MDYNSVNIERSLNNDLSRDHSNTMQENDSSYHFDSTTGFSTPWNARTAEATLACALDQSGPLRTPRIPTLILQMGTERLVPLLRLDAVTTSSSTSPDESIIGLITIMPSL